MKKSAKQVGKLNPNEVNKGIDNRIVITTLYDFLYAITKLTSIQAKLGFPKLCAAAHWRAVKRIKVCCKMFVF